MKRRFYAVLGVIWLLTGGFYLLTRLWHPAADWYIAQIFPHISGFWSRLTGLVPFSLGEWMILLGIALAVFGTIAFLLGMLFARKHRKQLASRVGAVCAGILTWVFVVVTMHFLVLYQGTGLRSQETGTFTNEEVLSVCALLVEGANAEATQVARDDNGHFVLQTELMPEAKRCMARLAETYPQFRGWYPDAKPIHHSYFFSQQNLLGVYYPHTLEVNYNPVVYPINLPVTVCHEYTHLKGNIFEDEAGFYAYLACMTSDSADFRYAAYISALEWMDPELGDDPAAQAEYEALLSQLTPDVWNDMYSYLPEDYWETHEQEQVIPSEVVSQTTDTVMDASLKVNGVSDGVRSYEGMTALLLHYYLDKAS